MKNTWKMTVMVTAILCLGIATVNADELRLKNGDRLTGNVVAMENDQLTFKTSYAGEITVNWSEVSNLNTETPIQVQFRDDTLLKGETKPAEEGKMKLKMGQAVETVSFNLAEVKAINPKPAGPPVKLKVLGNVGVSVSKGNTETSTYHFDGSFIARTVKNRYTLGAEYNRADEDGKKTANNALGFIKYDHFLTDKWYFYSNASFEHDEFKDLNLRTTVGIGSGYQFWETDLTNLSVEGGISYVNNDYDVAEDDSYPAGRWAVDYDRYFFGKFTQFFHFHEGFVSLKDPADVFVRSRTGFRFPLHKNLQATAQYNLDWDNKPAEGTKSVDQTYLLTLGYQY